MNYKNKHMITSIHIACQQKKSFPITRKALGKSKLVVLSTINFRLLDDRCNSSRFNFAFHALLGIIAQTGLFIGFSFMHCYVPICTINLKFVANLLQNCFFVAKSVNPLSGLFPRKSLNSLIDSPLTLFSLLLLLLRKYPLLY